MSPHTHHSTASLPTFLSNCQPHLPVSPPTPTTPATVTSNKFMATPAPAITAAEDGPTWAELLGSSDWATLLNPLHLSLRRLLLHCGDLCQATYDAFINDQGSRFCGSCRYGKPSFLSKVDFRSSLPHYSSSDDLTVHSFLYATARIGVPEAFLLRSRSRESWDRESNWIGYVAVTSDSAAAALGRREIYVAWRCTTRDFEWVNVLGADLEPIKPLLEPAARGTKPATSKGGGNYFTAFTKRVGRRLYMNTLFVVRGKCF